MMLFQWRKSVVGVRRFGIYYINFGAGQTKTCVSNLSLSLGQLIHYIIYTPFQRSAYSIVLIYVCIYKLMCDCLIILSAILINNAINVILVYKCIFHM